MSASELAIRVAEGSPEAEAELVRRFSRGVELIVSQSIPDRSVVEDIRQDTFRIAIQKIRARDLQSPDKLAGFVLAIARNLSITYHRRPARAEIGDEPLATRPDSGDTQLEWLLQQEKAALVRQILGEMHSARDREILHRFYLSEHAKERICEDLGLTSLHFNRVLFRARERYRELFEKRIGNRDGMMGGSAAH